MPIITQIFQNVKYHLSIQFYFLHYIIDLIASKYEY